MTFAGNDSGQSSVASIDNPPHAQIHRKEEMACPGQNRHGRFPVSPLYKEAVTTMNITMDAIVLSKEMVALERCGSHAV